MTLAMCCYYEAGKSLGGRKGRSFALALGDWQIVWGVGTLYTSISSRSSDFTT